MLFKLALKNVITRKSSYVIIIFMSFAITLFCVANAVFDSTEQGVQSNYISSFTGDFVIRPKGIQTSLFGDETPVTGELTRLDCVIPYSSICEYLNTNKNVSGFTGHITGMAALEFNGQRTPMYLFGVNSTEYFNLMTSVSIVQGGCYENGQRGAMLSTVIAEKYNIKVGDTVQFTVADGPNFRIRAAVVSGIYKYDIDNSIFERFILVDPQTIMSLLDMSDTQSENVEIADSKTNLLDQDLDLDSLFDDAQDSDGIFEEITENNANNTIVVQESFSSNSWNNIIVRLNDSQNSKKLIKKFNRYFKKMHWPVEAIDWRHAAGSTALYLYWMRNIFNAGIFIILIAGFIIVNNTLIVNILDRTKEIGTMRAIGAKKRFISLECMTETFLMTITSGIIGTIIGFFICKYITSLNIVLNNSFLVQLFGNDALNIFVTPWNVLKLFLLSILLGIIGWIYPVITALKVTPVNAMQGGK